MAAVDTLHVFIYTQRAKERERKCVRARASKAVAEQEFERARGQESEIVRERKTEHM